MKRFTTTLAVLLLASLPMMAERVTPETAQKAAQNFFNNNGAKSAQLTDLSKAAGFANLYIFTADQGFVVMAADDCVQPILGYSLTGKFVAENMPTNVSGWLQGYSDEIQFAIDSKAKATAETAKQWKDLIDGNSKAGRATAVVDNLLTTIWDQDPLYNNLCPYSNYYSQQTVTGCVATAMAQIMKYWEHPSSGIGSHSYEHIAYTQNVVINDVIQEIYHDGMGVLSADFGATTYDWDNMPASLNSSSTEAQIDAIATLMYHCGVSVEMDYGVAQIGGSGAVTAYVADALQEYFGYQQSTYQSREFVENWLQQDWAALLKTELDNGRPLQYSGRGTGGHSFVCCGYDSDDNFYFNWGWSGRNDGFFALNNLVPGSGGSGGSNYNFTNDQAAIFGIQPNTPSINPPTIATAVDGTNVTITWDEVSDADSYRLYRNGNLIASSLTTTSYTDTDLPYGEHAYHVKSVKSDGTMSLKSNISVAVVSFDGPVATDLTASLNGNTVNLSWTAPASESAILQYGSANPSGHIGFSGQAPFYWAQRYPVATLASYAGMAIDKVSVYFGYSGTYTLYIYNGDETGTSDLMYQTDYTASSTGWKDIDVTNIVPLDYTSDLWVVMYAPQSIAYPAGYCSYSGSGAEDAAYYSSSGSGWYSMGDNTSWVMKTYISDGTFTYNLYDGTNPVASNIEGTSYTVSNIADNAVHQYTVKTNYYGVESAASNMVGFAIGTSSIASLEMAANDQMTVTEGSQLTVSGTMSNDKAENLILEDGAQLIHSSNGVKATVKKTLSPYTSGKNDGWHFIASPVEETVIPTVENGLLANEYDLYYYDEPAHYWRNHKGTNETSNFKLNHMQGYLYANSAPTTLQFAGTLTPSTNSVTKENLSHSATELNGFNLVGNPFVCNATINQDCYVIEDSTVVLASNGKVFTPCEGAFVKATEENNHSVTFTKAGGAKSNGNNQCLDLVVFQDKSTLDRARVRMGEGTNMEKFSLDGNESTQLAFWHDGQEYAVAYMGTDTASELLINFKVAKNGTYSIGIETNSLDVDYLHLIDNMTGANIDLLQQPEYNFTAKTTDYASRFRLVFSNCEDAIGDNDDDGAFAYISNGEIVVVGDAGTASLQVVDMTGRVVVSVGGHTRCVPTTGIPAGVYVLRLIDGNDVKTQKIVIE